MQITKQNSFDFTQQSFPYEVAAHVLSFLPTYTEISKTGMVSKVWRSAHLYLLNNPNLLQSASALQYERSFICMNILNKQYHNSCGTLIYRIIKCVDNTPPQERNSPLMQFFTGIHDLFKSTTSFFDRSPLLSNGESLPLLKDAATSDNGITKFMLALTKLGAQDFETARKLLIESDKLDCERECILLYLRMCGITRINQVMCAILANLKGGNALETYVADKFKDLVENKNSISAALFFISHHEGKKDFVHSKLKELGVSIDDKNDSLPNPNASSSNTSTAISEVDDNEFDVSDLDSEDFVSDFEDSDDEVINKERMLGLTKSEISDYEDSDDETIKKESTLGLTKSEIKELLSTLQLEYGITPTHLPRIIELMNEITELSIEELVLIKKVLKKQFQLSQDEIEELFSKGK